MSYNLHEAFCLDSFQKQLLFWDDFEGDSIKDLWATTTGGAGVAGTAVVIDAQDGGIVRLSTTASDTNEIRVDWGGVTPIRTLLVSKKVTMEFRAKLTDITNTIIVNRLFYDLTNYIGFRKDNALSATNWYLDVRNAAGTTQLNSGVALDASYHIYRIECFPTGEVHFYIDEVETANSPITTNITTQYLIPYFRLINNGAAEINSMDIDYCYIRQER